MLMGPAAARCCVAGGVGGGAWFWSPVSVRAMPVAERAGSGCLACVGVGVGARPCCCTEGRAGELSGWVDWEISGVGNGSTAFGFGLATGLKVSPPALPVLTMRDMVAMRVGKS